MKRKKKLALSARRNLTGVLFVLPWMIGFAVFFAYPLVQSIIFSMNKVVFTAKGRNLNFVGADNYRDIFTKDAYFMERLLNFMLELAMELPLIIVFSLIIAILLNQKIKCKGLFRTLFFLPIIVVSGPVLGMLMDTGATTIPLIEQYGVYELIGSVLPEYLKEPVSTLFGELLLILWYSGVPTLIFFAGLQKIDGSLYEASYMDGASSWVSFWKIVLPSMKGMILIDCIYVTVFLATSEINDVIILIRSYMLDVSKGFGFASAMAWVYSVCIVLVILICFLLFGRKERVRRA